MKKAKKLNPLKISISALTATALIATPIAVIAAMNNSTKPSPVDPKPTRDDSWMKDVVNKLKTEHQRNTAHNKAVIKDVKDHHTPVEFDQPHLLSPTNEAGPYTINNGVLKLKDNYSEHEIPQRAYLSDTELTKISLSGQGNDDEVQLTTIGNSAFVGCKKLTSVAFSPNLTSIGERAFFNCNSIDILDFSAFSMTGSFNKKLKNLEIGTDSYHFEDWRLFAGNIRENAKVRIDAFIEAHK